MKRMIAIVLLFALSLTAAGCKKDTPEFVNPVQVYYRRFDDIYGTEPGVICAITIEGTDRLSDPISLLNDYLSDSDPIGAIPFPKDTKLQKLTISGDTAVAELSASFARLEGMDLTIACACITMTIMELTGVESVAIRCADRKLNGAVQIVMSRDSLILLDLYDPNLEN